MLALSFQPTWCEWHWAFARWRCRAESWVAARLPFHPGVARLGADLDADNFVQFLADPSKLLPGTAMTSWCLTRPAAPICSPILPRSRTRRLGPNLRVPPFRTGPTEPELR